jgi:hypothetical protein
MPETDKPYAATMQRTKIQLATTYAPGTLFTFEGNLVVCESKPERNYARIRLPKYASDQVFMVIEERIAAWYELAIGCSPHTVPKMCVDMRLLNKNYDGLAEPFVQSIFGFVEPEKVGYQPTLFTMICNTCNLVKIFDSIGVFNRRIAELDANDCKDPISSGSCDWRQTDIVFVHPNGNYCQPLPWKYDWDSKKGAVVKREFKCRKCGSFETRLNSESAQIGKRFFYCASCGMRRNSQWIQNDEESLELFRDDSSSHLSEIRMKPISYRANSVHYPQQDMVIDFGDSSLLEGLADQTNRKLITFIGNRFGLPAQDPSEEEIQAAVTSKLGEEDWTLFVNSKKSVEGFEALSEEHKALMKRAIDLTKQQIERKMEEWRQNGIIDSKTVLSNLMLENIDSRRNRFSTKYDPFRLLVEHEALLQLVVNDNVLENGLKSYTSLDQLDEHLGPADLDERTSLNLEHRQIMDSIGIETAGLVRNFKTVHFSFGYSRVGSTPRTTYINDTPVPVRLKLFPRAMIDEQRVNPIYVLRQDNEAIYVRLNEETVRKWLNGLYPDGDVSSDPIGMQFLENVPEMSTFLDGLPGKELDKPQLSLAIYSLLHTYSHHFINAISEYSGLSSSSLAEYLFPADLSFLVFRRGMTMDLGNMTAMLRNNAPAFLNFLKEPRNLACGSGSLCLNRGGACPDCLMIPEMNCLTQNQLLSRSLLIGGGSPQKHGFDGQIDGYLEVNRATL